MIGFKRLVETLHDTGALFMIFRHTLQKCIAKLFYMCYNIYSI